jgi:acetyl-CoA synthetase
MSAIESVLNETRIFPPSASFVAQANVSGMTAYQALCDEAARDFEGFWGRLAREYVLWHKPFTKVLDESNPPFFKWFDDGQLNASYNCLDRHLKTQPDKVAIIFEGDDGSVTKITYKQLYHRVCQFANGLKSLGIKLGDRVIIYLPISIEAVIAMQACARIGATHSVVFGGFSAKSLQERIVDAGAVAVITADGGLRGGKEVPLKPAVDEASHGWLRRRQTRGATTHRQQYHVHARATSVGELYQPARRANRCGSPRYSSSHISSRAGLGSSTAVTAVGHSHMRGYRPKAH